MMKTTLLIASAAIALSACTNDGNDASSAAIRNGPQTQSPWADAPEGKLPEDDAAATPVIIIDDSASS